MTGDLAVHQLGAKASPLECAENPLRPALTAPPLHAEAAERIRALLGIGIKRGHPIGIHPKQG